MSDTKVILDEEQIGIIKAIVEEYLVPGARAAAIREVKEFMRKYGETPFTELDVLKDQVKYLKAQIDKIKAGQEALGLILMGKPEDKKDA